jgi:hypothetical protein
MIESAQERGHNPSEDIGEGLSIDRQTTYDSLCSYTVCRSPNDICAPEQLLTRRPQLVFLDEPTIGLDVPSARNLRQEGVPVFPTTH